MNVEDIDAFSVYEYAISCLRPKIQNAKDKLWTYKCTKIIEHMWKFGWLRWQNFRRLQKLNCMLEYEKSIDLAFWICLGKFKFRKRTYCELQKTSIAKEMHQLIVPQMLKWTRSNQATTFSLHLPPYSSPLHFQYLFDSFKLHWRQNARKTYSMTLDVIIK